MASVTAWRKKTETIMTIYIKLPLGDKGDVDRVSFFSFSLHWQLDHQIIFKIYTKQLKFQHPNKKKTKTIV